MKRILTLLITICISMSIFTACSLNKKEISRELINARYTPAHSSTKTDYEYKYNWNKDEYEYVPGIKYVNEPEKYEFEYIVTYDDDTTRHVFETVTEEAYNEYMKSKWFKSFDRPIVIETQPQTETTP